MTERQLYLLHRLARLYGLQTSYYDFAGRRQKAPPYSLLAVLQALGAPVESLADVPGAVRERTQELWSRCCEPVLVAWEGRPAYIELRLPAAQAHGVADCRLELENGETRCWNCNLASLPVLQVEAVEGVDYIVRQLVLPFPSPWGYHRLVLTLPMGSYETLVIAAPSQAYTPTAGTTGRIWGVFLPLYALHSERSWAAGDLTDLEALLYWVKGLGGSVVGTLPLLPTFLDQPFDPSPYVPVSRMFWNEFYLDITRIPELEHCPAAQDLLNSPVFQNEIALLRAAPLVDYRRGMALKRKILEHLAGCCFTIDSGRQVELKRWAAAHPRVQDYARFRAALERQGATWPTWPERMRDGFLREGDYNPDVERYHLYVQWLAHEQLQTLSTQARQWGSGMYLDLPLGVHRAGYDVWRERSLFALEASGGAPPDMFFTEGQDWGFPPLHPERIREQGYRYYIACLRHHLGHAGVLRLDHVMGLHRLFWIPRGLTARDGVYVHYRAEEFYAILALESQRHQTLIVGEDLGTVPRYVREAMGRHKIRRMYILSLEFTPDPRRALSAVPSGALAGLNTHDMLPFAAFWLGKNRVERLALATFLHQKGWLEALTDDTEMVLQACLAYLAASRAQILLVNLEDLWQEMAPQNIPGTDEEHPNWRRKACYSFEEFSLMPGVEELLGKIRSLR